ncbi:hypothetical protein PN447_00450 [Anabaena sp. CS-542/02]|nr:hypothetical protein [Anabaena sp. CS-542/02]
MTVNGRSLNHVYDKRSLLVLLTAQVFKQIRTAKKSILPQNTIIV